MNDTDKYTYFVSYAGEGNLFGNTSVTMDRPIRDMSAMPEIEKAIGNEHGVAVVVLNFHLLSSPAGQKVTRVKGTS